MTQTALARSAPDGFLPEPTPVEINYAVRYLENTRDEITGSVSGLSEAQWSFKESPDRWSIAEIVEHLVIVEQSIHAIVRTIGDAPEAPADWRQTATDDFIVATVPVRSTAVQAPPFLCPIHCWSQDEALNHFLVARTRTILLLSAQSLRGRVVPHPVLGPWDGYQWLLAAAAHSARHTGQIREVKASPDFPLS